MWTARKLVGNVTADLTTLQRVHQEHSTGIKKKKKKKQNLKQNLPLVNKEKHFTDLKFKGSKRL